MSGFYCGAAKAVITPCEEWLPKLKCGREYFGGVADDILVRAIAVGDGSNRMIFVGFDLDKDPYPDECVAWISENTGIPEENIFLFGTHTHAVPRLGPRKFEPMWNSSDLSADEREVFEAYEQFVMEKMHEVVLEAVSSMKPARFGTGKGNCYIGVNRTERFAWTDENGNEKQACRIGYNPEGPVDHTVFTLKIEDLEGNVIACLVNYAVHCAVLFPNNLGKDGRIAVTGDIGGNVSRLVETKYPGSVAIWSSAPSGDVNPFLMNAYVYPDPLTGEPVHRELRGGDRGLLDFFVARHYSVVNKVLDDIECDKSSAEISGSLDLIELPMKKAQRTREGWDISDEWDENPYTIRLHLVNFGDLAFLGVGGELFTRLGWIAKEAAPVETVIITHDHSQSYNAGYIGDDEGLTYHAHGTAGGLAPGLVGPALEKSVKKLFASQK